MVDLVLAEGVQSIDLIMYGRREILPLDRGKLDLADNHIVARDGDGCGQMRKPQILHEAGVFRAPLVRRPLAEAGEYLPAHDAHTLRTRLGGDHQQVIPADFDAAAGSNAEQCVEIHLC